MSFDHNDINPDIDNDFYDPDEYMEGEGDEFYTGDEEGLDLGENGEQEQQEQQEPTTSEEVLSALDKMLKDYGIEHDTAQYKENGLDANAAKTIFMQQVGLKALEAVDPAYAVALKEGIDPSAYRQQISEVQSLLDLDNTTLAKDFIYRQLWEQENRIGALPENQQEAEKYIMDMTEAKAKALGAKLEGIAANYRQELVKHKEAIPMQLKAAQENYYKAQQADFDKKVDAFLASDNAKSYLGSGGIIPYKDAAEQEDFAKYSKTMLSISQGKGTTELMERLKDPQTMMNVLRVLHAQDKGYFKEVSKRAETEVFKKLDLFADTRGQGVGGGSKHIDTSKPHKTPI